MDNGTILNIDAQEASHHVRSRILEQKGFKVLEATTGSEGLQLIAREQPTLVMLQGMLPDLSPAELCRRIKRDIARSVLIIHIAAAASGEPESPPEGADIYLREPLVAEELIATVITLTRLHAAVAVQVSLEQAEERFQTWLKMTGSVFCTANPQGAVIEPQPYYQAFTGLTAAECQGQGWLKGIHPDDRERVQAVVLQGIEKQQPVECELRLWHAASRRYRWLLERIIPQFDAAGSLRGWVGAGVDIQALKAAEAALQKADRCKDEFLAILAHELRNPLAPIRNAVQILQQPGAPEPQLQWAYGVIDRQVNHLARLVDDLLDVSRLAQGKIRLHLERVDIATVVERALELSRPFIQSRGHQLSVALPIEPLPVRGDIIRLVQVIQNLLNNAAKYTPEGGRIRLEVRRENDQVVILVRDNGKGISAELLPYIFDLFRQGEGGLERQQGGLGIGLALVRRLLHLHGGQVEARSDGVGQGSEFIVRLPLSVILPSDNQLPVVEKKPRRGKPPRRILVVDDNVDFAETLALLLETQGYEARIALDGPTALELALESQPEVILLDLGLPGMDGYAVVRQLRARAETRNVVFIAVTGHGQPEDRVCTQAASFDHHLVKPIAWEELDRLLTACR